MTCLNVLYNFLIVNDLMIVLFYGVKSRKIYLTMLMKKLLILPLLFLSFAQAETFQCKVVGVTDGDTITCLTEAKKQVKVRLYQIDAPESGQAYGQKAKQALSDMIYDKVVWVDGKGTDRYNRMLGAIRWDICSPIVTTPICHQIGKSPPSASDINLKMIQQGYAWHYPFTKKNPEYQQAEQEAKAAKRGLWTDKHALPPWEWRKERKREKQ